MGFIELKAKTLHGLGSVFEGSLLLKCHDFSIGLQLSLHHLAAYSFLYAIEKPTDFTAEVGKTYGLLSYTGEEGGAFVRAHRWDSVVALSPGCGKHAEAAIRLFYAMREIDEMGLVEIIAKPVTESGLGVVIMDRLRRASARSVG